LQAPNVAYALKNLRLPMLPKVAQEKPIKTLSRNGPTYHFVSQYKH